MSYEALKKSLLADAEREERQRLEEDRQEREDWSRQIEARRIEREAEEKRQTAADWNRRQRQRRLALEQERRLRLDQDMRQAAQERQDEERGNLLRNYGALYELCQKARANGKLTEFMDWVEKQFGFPYYKFIYSEEEKERLPLMATDLPNTKLLLRVGLWPFKRSPLGEMVGALRQLGHREPEKVMDERALIHLFLSMRADALRGVGHANARENFQSTT